jgi:hypothetical protein
LVLTAPALAQAVPSDAPTGGAAVESHERDRAMAILGCAVRDPNGKVIGRLIDVLVDPEGQPSAAVIDFGGFLGVGSRKVAVAWSALRIVTEDKTVAIQLNLTADQLKVAPEYKDASKSPVPVVAAPASGGPGPAAP